MLKKFTEDLKDGKIKIVKQLRESGPYARTQNFDDKETTEIIDLINGVEPKITPMDTTPVVVDEGYKYNIVEPIDEVGEVSPLFSNTSSGVLRGRPDSITKISTKLGDTLYIVSNRGVNLLDENGSNMGTLLTYSSLSDSGFVYRSLQTAVSPDGTKLSVTNYHAHTIDIYELNIGDKTVSIGQLISRYGVFRSAGDLISGKLKYPYGVAWLDDTNIVSTSSGRGIKADGSSNRHEGHISHYVLDVNLGTLELVKTLFGSETSRSFSANECSISYFIKQYEDIYTIGTDKDEVVEIKLPIVAGEVTPEILNIYAKPPSITVSRITPTSAVILDENTIAIVARAIGKIVYMNRHTRDIVGAIGEMFWDDKSDADNGINQFYNPTDMVIMDAENYLVADSGNSRLVRAMSTPFKTIKYDLSPDCKIIKTFPYTLDADNCTKISASQKAQPLMVIYEEGM